MSAYSIATRGLPQGVLTPMDDLLFSASEPGAWYDPSDMSTLFQDSAGTVPVTAVEQPVGRILDKSGRGNHASMATTTKRPVYSRRVNLHTFNTNTFADAALLKSGNGLLPVVTPNYAAAPDGSITAVRLQLNSVDTSGTAYSLVAGNISGGGQIAAAYRTSIWMRATTGTATVGLIGTGTVVVFQSLNTTWREVSINETGFAGSPWALRISSAANATTAGPQDILVWHPSLTLETDAHLPYQRVTTASDYDADPSKFPAYLRFDGVDDALQTGNIDFTGTDKMTVWAGVTKLSDAANALVYEFSSTESLNVGSFSMWAPTNLGAVPLGATAKGATSRSVAATSGFSGVASGVVVQDTSLSAPRNALRLNGATLSTETTALGGSFGNYPLYIGARAGDDLYFNGRLYGLVLRAGDMPQATLEATELYMKQKMRLP